MALTANTETGPQTAASDETDQKATIAFLADPATHGVETVETVETHISHVFLAGERVYKLKKAVTLDFVDFSTLAGREKACRAELSVNRRAAPSLYLGVRAVMRGADGALRLGEPERDATILDWVVEMRRFPQEAELDHMARDGRLERSHILALADRLAELHATAERRPDFGGASVGGVIDEIERVLGAEKTEASLRAAALDWVARARAELSRQAPRLEARRRHGYVRHCHGDMHLANICWIDGQPTPFDAIEFNQEFASTDVLYDLAFPVMDLLDHGLPRLASALIGRYLGATRDYRSAGLLPLLVSIRAAVRAMTAALSGDRDAPPRRMALALRMLQPAERRLIAIGGASGTGKSTLAGALAPELPPLGAIWLRSDEIRKRLLGVAPEERLPESAYDPATGSAVYRRMTLDAGRALLAGMPVLMDAAFLSAAERAAAADLASKRGARFDGLWLELALAGRRARLEARRGDASDATPEIAELQEQKALADANAAAANWRRVNASGDPDTVLRRARKALEETGPNT